MQAGAWPPNRKGAAVSARPLSGYAAVEPCGHHPSSFAMGRELSLRQVRGQHSFHIATPCCFGKGAGAQDFAVPGLKARMQRARGPRRTDTVGAGIAGDSA
jgi:hypothetical protein